MLESDERCKPMPSGPIPRSRRGVTHSSAPSRSRSTGFPGDRSVSSWTGGALVPVYRSGIQNVRWVRPVLVGTIEYREMTRRLRHSSWRGLRTDKSPDEVIWPELDDQS